MRVVCCGMIMIAAGAAAAGNLWATQPEQIVLPHEPLGAASLAAEWRIDASEGNVLTVKDGRLVIDARLHTYAHVQRPLGIDRIRIRAAVQADDAVSWTPMLCLYWSARNYVQLGAIRGLQPYAIAMRNGKVVPAGGWFSKSSLWRYDAATRTLRDDPSPDRGWRHVAIDLQANDVVLEDGGEDGATWRIIDLIPRGEEFAGPPALVIAGKGFTAPPGLPNPDLNNDFGDPGDRQISQIKDLVIEASDALDPARLATVASGRDILGELELAGPSDPTFESVSRHFPPLQFSREVVGVKDHPHDVGVLPDAAIQIGSAILAFEIGDPPTAWGGGEAFPTKELHDGWIPLVHARKKVAGLRLEQSVFAHSPRMSPEAPLSAYIRLRVVNETTKPSALRLRLAGCPDNAEARWSNEIDPGQAWEVHLRVPYLPADGGPRTIDAATFKRAMAEYIASWSDILGRGTHVDLPEPRVSNAYRAWLAYNFLNVDKRDGVFHVTDGKDFYPAVYGYSACLAVQAFDLFGQHTAARAYLDSLVSMVDPSGLFELNFGLPDHGSLLVTLWHHHRLTDDGPWLESVAPVIVRMCEWIRMTRARFRDQQEPTGNLVGLIPGRPFCDHPQPAYYYVSDMTMVVGLEKAAAALAAIGWNQDAEWIAAEAVAYRRDVMASMARSRINRQGAVLLPMFPETQELLRAADYKAWDYFGLATGPLLEVDALPPDSREAEIFANMLESRGGLTLGVTRFWGGIDHAYAFGYWRHCLERRAPQKAVLALYTSLAYGMSRDTYAAVEVTFIEDGKNFATLPHTYSNTQQLRLLRTMLLSERDDVLRVGWGVPSAWLAGGKRVAIKDAPTFFGAASIVIESAPEADRMRMDIEVPGRNRLREIQATFRHPEGKPIRQASVNGQPVDSFVEDTVVITAPDRNLRVDVGF